MANGLTNAGFLDSTTGWAPGPGLTLAVDETDSGAPGRAVLIGAGSVSGGATARVSTSTSGRATVEPYQLIDAFACVAARLDGVAVAPSAWLTFRDAGGSILESVAMTVRAPLLGAHGVARRGAPSTFHVASIRTTAPASAAKASLEIETTAPAPAAAEVMLLKPFVGASLGVVARAPLWDPGTHTPEELQLSAWPTLLRPFSRSQGGEPRPWAVEFEAGPSAPAFRRSAVDPARRFTGRLRCDEVERAELEAFARSASRFWFVEPDSDRLCVGRFTADGAPRLSEIRGAVHHMEMSLWLETA